MRDALSTTTGRVVVFFVVTALALGVGIGYVLLRNSTLAENQPASAQTRVDKSLTVAEVLAQPHIVFRSTTLGPTFGKLALVPLSDPGGDRAVTALDCDRVYAAASAGVCVTAHRGLTTSYSVSLLDSRLRPRASAGLDGFPSRARMSSDGSLASTSMFVAGHSYAGGAFSTETLIRDVATDKDMGNLQNWRIVINGHLNTEVDLNVWGVTFAGGPHPNTFYATVSTAGKQWLAVGDIKGRALRAIHEGVECPSLSPDGTHIAFKKRETLNGRTGWQLTVLDLATMTEHALGETRSVDDQPEWLDNDNVLYGLQRTGSATSDVWVAPMDGSKPRVFIPRAWSPAVVTTPTAGD